MKPTRSCSRQVTVACDNARLYRLAVEDPESGLYVPGYLASRAREEIDRASEAAAAVALVGLRLMPAAPDLELPAEVVRRLLPELARELRRVCHERELVARSGALECRILVPDGGRARGEEIEQIVRRLLDRHEDRVEIYVGKSTREIITRDSA